MIYKNFRLNCTLRVVFLAVTIFAFFFLLYETAFYVTPVFAGLLIAYQVFSLIRYVEKTDRILTTFLESIRYADFSQTFSVEGLGKSYDDLKTAFNGVLKDFRKIRREREEQYHYLQSVIHHIGIGLMAFYEDGTVEMINNAAKRILQVNMLKNLKDLEPLDDKLADTIRRMKAGERKLVEFQSGDDLLHLAVYATEFKIREKPITLISIHNIQSELEEKEMEAWQQLIRVLTHEIMNTITPIASLASTADDMMNDMSVSGDENLADIKKALTTIHTRSTGLLHFVESYRSLTNIAKPHFKIFPVKGLFQNIQLLMGREFEDKAIRFSVSVVPDSLELTADEKLVEQVLINILKNSVHAVDHTGKGKMELRALLNKRGRVTMQAVDNGCGIMPDTLEKIFIPFFTTKPGGSGIGLSLSRQIMRLHGGNIAVKSQPDSETVFTLQF